MSEPLPPEVFRAASPTDESDPERRWLREVYQGDHARQLTVRAVVAGMLLGGVMSLSNLYIALKTGWSFGVTITAGILAYVIFNVLKRVGLAREEFGMLENNAMQSVASAAGYMTGGGTVAAIPALMLATHTVISGWTIFFWITPIAMLGVFMAIPMKRQMINQEGLKFPSGIAAAETLRGLHPEEAAAMDARRTDRPGAAVDSEGARLAGRALIWSAGVGALVLWLREARATWIPSFIALPEHLAFPFKMRGVAAMKWSIFFDTSLLLIAAGAIMGWRSAWSMLLGGLINYFALAPHGVDIHEIAEVKIRAISQWTVWFGSPLLLTSGLLSFAFSWRQIARAFSGLSGLFSKVKPANEDPMAAVEVPIQWFVYGMGALTPVVMFFAWKLFGIAWWMSLLCVVMSFFIAIVACRATGETDTTPTGALGKITQLVFGVVAPGSITTNLMCASMSGGVAIHSADMLTDLKSGYLLGAKPRQQFAAQFFGVLAGSLFVVPAFRLLVPDYTVIGTPAIPAPAALAWEAVSRALSQGVSHLPPGARTMIGVGAMLGVVMVLVEKALPPKLRRFFPSPVGFGLAFTMPFSNTLSMFVGAVIALAFERWRPKAAERYLVPVSSGIIAGESLIGILIKVLVRFGLLAG
ncbi:MAG: Oligopeptide transporter, family [Myxococcaceae bacterium]|nr:Oligopeptide transporter, family [Myxococcaceae bacterium]